MIDWIFSIINQECQNTGSFADVFAGTGVVSAAAIQYFDEIIINDFLYSNYTIYEAFFANEQWNKEKLIKIVEAYNILNSRNLKDNYFSQNFGGKYFSMNSARFIGFIREDIEKGGAGFKQ